MKDMTVEEALKIMREFYRGDREGWEEDVQEAVSVAIDVMEKAVRSRRIVDEPGH